MSDDRPPIVDELLAGPYPCCLTTLGDRGMPYSVVVWCGPRGSRVTVNAANGRWLTNLRREPRLSLLVVDTADIMRYFSLQGRAIEIDADDRYDHINSLSQIYEGRPYAYSTPEDVPRFRVTIEPERIRTVDLSPA